MNDIRPGSEASCARCHTHPPVTAGYGTGVFCAGCIDLCHEAPEFDHVCVICATPAEAQDAGFRIPPGWRN